MIQEAITAATEALDNAQNAYLANPSARNGQIYREAKERRATLILDAFDDGLLRFADESFAALMARSTNRGD